MTLPANHRTSDITRYASNSANSFLFKTLFETYVGEGRGAPNGGTIRPDRMYDSFINFEFVLNR